MLFEYHKIEGLFKRKEDGKRELIYGSYRNQWVDYLKDCKWIFTEKIDGTNIRVYWDGHKVSFYGRTDRAQIPNPLFKYLEETFSTEQAEELFEQKFGEKEVILFGEGYGGKIQKGSSYRADQSFILFDVNIDGVFLGRKDVENIATVFGIDVVPVIMYGTIEEAVEFVKKNPNSTIGTAKMEGLIGKPIIEMNDKFGKRIIVKIKWNDMKEFL